MDIEVITEMITKKYERIRKILSKKRQTQDEMNELMKIANETPRYLPTQEQKLIQPSQRLKTLRLLPGRYSLVRELDKKGNFGGLVIAVHPETHKQGDHFQIRLGWRLRCGSIYPRTYLYDSYWYITLVILSLRPHHLVSDTMSY